MSGKNKDLKKKVQKISELVYGIDYKNILTGTGRGWGFYCRPKDYHLLNLPDIKRWIEIFIENGFVDIRPIKDLKEESYPDDKEDMKYFGTNIKGNGKFFAYPNISRNELRENISELSIKSMDLD